MSLCTPAVPCIPAAVAPCGPARVAAFDAVLYPNRSLGRFGFYALMSAIVLASAGIGAAFMLVGAWPVTGFFGLDAVLLYLAFRWNYRTGRCAEIVRLDQDGLCVRQVRPNGATQEWRFEPYWVRVTIDEPLRHDSQLVLSSHGRALAIGSFLTAEERAEVARALRAALAAHRQCQNVDATARDVPPDTQAAP